MERRPLRDLDAKSFLSIKQILAYLLKGTVEAYEDKSVSEIVGFLNAELSEKDRENYRLQGCVKTFPLEAERLRLTFTSQLVIRETEELSLTLKLRTHL